MSPRHGSSLPCRGSILNSRLPRGSRPPLLLHADLAAVVAPPGPARCSVVGRCWTWRRGGCGGKSMVLVSEKLGAAGLALLFLGLLRLQTVDAAEERRPATGSAGPATHGQQQVAALFMEGWHTKSSSLTRCSGTSSSACPSANSYASQVFTNGDRMHASRALKRLGIEDYFEGVLCFETLNPTSPIPVPSDKVEIFDIMKHLAHPEPGVELPRSPILCKPNIDAMLHALKLVDINPQTTIFFDDSVRNIQAGKQIGMHTVLVGTSERIKGADHALESLHNMKEAFPELWEEAVKDEDVRNSSKVGIETSVIA